MPENDVGITGSWVELRQEGGGKIVLKDANSDLPPARGRRMLRLLPGHVAEAGNPGPSDRLEGPSGTWELRDGRLHLDLPGWAGSYRIEKTDQETLTLLTD